MLLLEVLFGVLLIVAVRLLFGRHLGPRYCRLLWGLVILRALLPLTLPSPYHPLGLLPSGKIAEITETVLPPTNSDPAGGDVPQPPAVSHVEFEPNSAKDLVPPTETSKTFFSWKPVLFGIWFCGFATILTTAAFHNRRIIAEASRFPSPVPDWVQTLFLEIREQLRLGTWPVLIVTPCTPTPCLVGAVRPRILIPESLLEGEPDREAIRCLLLHEMIHLKQGDIWFSWCWTLVQAVHWYNPLFWVLGRFVHLDCEAAVDERVLTELETVPARKHYADSLLEMMQTLNPPPFRAVGLSAVIETPSNLERRLNMMMLYQKPNSRRALGGVAVLSLLAVLALTGQAQEKPKPIAAEKAIVIGYVEDYLMHNFRDVTMRKSLEWGDVKTDAKGNRTIRYKCEALIWDKERIIGCWDFTFDKEGNWVSDENVKGYPQEIAKPDTSTVEGMKKLVEKFFSQNYRDITARKTIEWGEPKTLENGNRSIRYQYEATIWDKDKILENKEFVFTKEGEYVSVEKIEGYPKPISPSEKKPTAEKAVPAVKHDVKGSQNATAAAWRLFMQGNFAEAEPKFQEGVRLNSKNANAYQGLGWAQTNLGKSEEAKETFARCLELDPKNAAALNGLGMLAKEEGDDAKMIEYWERGAKADKKATGPIAGLADYYEQKGDKENAVKYFKMWLEADPNDPKAKSGLDRVSGK